ncbi:MAG: polymer-forming cytoskeletal protein [Verrucomicrobiaceae bacterium]|nr:polymer-forming cytoskeletal protein [Verrucomicrobiaceae bacterium]
MLRGLLGFGKSDRPQPPKGKIEVVCPTCGAVQYEPRLVVSTFCKKCGDHLRIDKKRVTGTGVRHYGPLDTSGAEEPARAPGTDVESAGPPSPAGSPKTAPLAVARSASPATGPLSSKWDRKNVLRSIIGTAAVPSQSESNSQNGNGAASLQKTGGTPAEETDDDADGEDTGFGRMIERANAAVSPPAPEPGPAAAPPKVEQFNQPTEADMSLRPHSSLPPPTPAPPPASASTLQKMKDQGFYRQQYFKEALCFDCNHAFKVGRSARSANCPQCGAWISMEDVEINMNSTQAIKTRGDVIIRKRGHLSTASVQCKDFHCQGLLEANVTATGDACFKTSGTIIGEVRCHRLVIEKGADVTFVNPIHAEQVEIHAKITGAVFSRGQVLITSYGAVNGDVTARSVSIEPGGELNGAMNIIRGDTPVFAAAAKLVG